MNRKILSELKPGESAYVRKIATDDVKLARKLTDMGITPGTEITLIKFAPLGDPMELHLRGYSLSLRKDDAAVVELMDEKEALHNIEEAKNARQKYEKAGKAAIDAAKHADKTDKDEHKRAEKLTDVILNASSCSGNCVECSKECLHSAFKSYDKQKKKKAKNASVPEDDEGTLRLALVGNPNCGKTTLFNAMTGQREYVGNWPGVTVEKKEGRVKSTKNGIPGSGKNPANKNGKKGEDDGLNTYGHDMILVDLPGIYSLSPFGMEELIARQYILQEKPDAIINIVDATNLERNLYLTVQLLELERPMVIALNMMDEVKKRGDTIDCAALSKELGIPVVPISARTGMGIDDLVSQANILVSAQLLLRTAHEQLHEGFNLEPDHLYDDFTHGMHHRIDELISDYAQKAGLPVHWASIKLLEGDEPVADALKLPDDIRSQVDEISNEYADAAGSSFAGSAALLADSRYDYIEKISNKVLKRKHGTKEATITDKIDKVLTNKYLAIPIFILIMALVFTLTFGTLGAWLQGLMEKLIFDITIPAASKGLASISAPEWLIGIICDGIMGGVGGVLTFLPWITILFLCLSLLEDSGYMSRIAFIMDKPMRKLGLSGKSFIPLLMGFGCTVPATMATRAMESMRSKRNTIFLLPFMSCSAKLPVYGLIAGAFFSKGKLPVVLSLYLLGILLAIVFGLITKKFIVKKEEAAFMLELPAYRIPKFKDTVLHVWERVKHFLVKAGTLILVMSVVVWLMMSFDFRFNYVRDNVGNSMLGKIGSSIAFLFKPIGLKGPNAWMPVVALITGFVAKESIVSTMSVLVGSTLTAGNAAQALAGVFTPLSAYAFLVFVLLYTPCMAAVATMRKELGSRKYTLCAVLFQIGIAYLMAFLVYSIGSIFTA